MNQMVLAQNDEKKSKIDLTVLNWTTLMVQNQLSIDYIATECDPGIGYKKENIHLRFTNLSTETIQITWHAILEYSGECKTCDYPEEYSYELVLKPNEVLEGDCRINYDNRLVIFSKYLDEKYTGKSQLTDFELRSLTILPLQ